MSTNDDNLLNHCIYFDTIASEAAFRLIHESERKEELLEKLSQNVVFLTSLSRFPKWCNSFFPTLYKFTSVREIGEIGKSSKIYANIQAMKKIAPKIHLGFTTEEERKNFYCFIYDCISSSHIDKKSMVLRKLYKICYVITENFQYTNEMINFLRSLGVSIRNIADLLLFSNIRKNDIFYIHKYITNLENQ